MKALKTLGDPTAYSSIRAEEVFERDNWRCYLCGRSVHPFQTLFLPDPKLKEERLQELLSRAPHGHILMPHIPATEEFQRSASLDHFIPLRRNGTHVADNLYCCCRRCNSEKEARTALERILFSLFVNFDGQPWLRNFIPPLTIGEVASLWRHYLFDEDNDDKIAAWQPPHPDGASDH